MLRMVEGRAWEVAGNAGRLLWHAVQVAPGSRHPAWYETEAESRPVLMEVVRLYKAGLADLSSRPREVPNILDAARLLGNGGASRGQFVLVSALLDRILAPDDATWIKSEFFREAAGELLGHAANTFGLPFAKRRGIVASDRCFQAVDTFRRHDRGGQEAAILRAVASAIELVLKQAAVPAVLAKEREARFYEAPAAPTPYIHRARLEQQLADLIKNGMRVIAVAGPSSVGKRSLLWNVLRESYPGVVARIDGRSPELTRQSIVETLLGSGMPYEKIGMMPRYQLKSLLEGENSPDYLVIENASDGELVQYLAADNARTTIIVTTTRRLQGLNQASYLEVGRMRSEEAVELVTRLLPASDEHDAALLAEVLDNQVLPIKTACGMMRASPEPSISGFCHQLKQNIAVIFDGEQDAQQFGQDPALTQMYRKTLTDLGHENPQALRALELTAFLHESSALSAFIVLALGSALGIDPENKIHLRAVAQRAISALCDRYLIEIDEQGLISMPAVAKMIIADLLHDRGNEICSHLRKGILSLVALSRREWPDMPLDSFLQQHRLTLLHLMNTYIDPKKSGELPEYLYMYGQALGALLREIGFPQWRVAILAFGTSPDSFSIGIQILPEALEKVARPVVEVTWNDPEPHRFQFELNDWEARKAMQVFLIDRSAEPLPPSSLSLS